VKAALVAGCCVAASLLTAGCGSSGKNTAAPATTAAKPVHKVAAANAWHQGYTRQDANVYWKWVEGQDCQDYPEYGCWHVEVIARHGCPRYVEVKAIEMAGGTEVNSVRENWDSLQAKTPMIFQLDLDMGGITAGNVTVDCQ
jgi:hypothetical protein